MIPLHSALFLVVESSMITEVQGGGVAMGMCVVISQYAVKKFRMLGEYLIT